MTTLSRRNFLKTAGLAGGAGLVAGIVGCSPSTSGSSASEANGDPTAQSASSEPSFLTPPEAIADDQIANTVESDVIVLGAGTAGLVTALSALQEGLSVTLVTASSTPIGRGGSNCAIYSRIMEAVGVEKIPYDVVTNELLQASYMPDQRKWARFY